MRGGREREREMQIKRERERENRNGVEKLATAKPGSGVISTHEG